MLINFLLFLLFFLFSDFYDFSYFSDFLIFRIFLQIAPLVLAYLVDLGLWHARVLTTMFLDRAGSMGLQNHAPRLSEKHIYVHSKMCLLLGREALSFRSSEKHIFEHVWHRKNSHTSSQDSPPPTRTCWIVIYNGNSQNLHRRQKPVHTNQANTRWTSADRNTKATLNTYNTWIQISRLQKIYHFQHLKFGLAPTALPLKRAHAQQGQDLMFAM